MEYSDITATRISQLQKRAVISGLTSGSNDVAAPRCDIRVCNDDDINTTTNSQYIMYPSSINSVTVTFLLNVQMF